MIKLQFATLQILNRTFRFKLESLLIYLLFSPFTVLSYFKQHQKEKISFSPDKRLNWNAMRFDNTRDIQSFWRVVDITRQGGLIAYENTMEVSIRGYNLIDNFKENFPLVIKLHLAMSFIANKAFPDLYVKRRGLSLADESNNHRFYNLLFEALFQKTFFNKKTNLKLFKFVEDRLDENGFLNEGASFYHLGVLWALKYSMEAHKIAPPDWLSLKKLYKALNSFDKTCLALSKINFGDRDDTLVAGFELYEYLSKNVPNELNPVPGQYLIKSKSLQSLYIRLSGEINFGTGGHFHDDFGHMTLFQESNEILIPDPGIFLYDNEPNLCLSKSHNLPTPVHEVSMMFRSRFTRTKIANERVFFKDSNLNIQKIHTSCKVTRSISQKHDFIESLDFAQSERSQSYQTSFLICNVDNPDEIEFDGEAGLVALPKISLQFFSFEKIELDDSFYCPQYGKKLVALNLTCEWNFEGNHNAKLLKVIVS